MLNRLREKFEKGEQAIGTFFCMSNVAVMECLGYTGLDYVIIDTEHGVFDTQPMSDLIKAAEHGGITPLVRIADVTHKEIQRAVDNGAGGLIVPCLRDIEDIKSWSTWQSLPLSETEASSKAVAVGSAMSHGQRGRWKSTWQTATKRFWCCLSVKLLSAWNPSRRSSL